MLRITPLLIVLITLLTAATCNKNSSTPTGNNCFKGKLVIKGICMNYVVQVLEGDTAKLNLAATWVDETDNKTYNNVFALGSKCSFPDMAEGSEFYFTLADKPEEGCNVCLAYRPVPPASNYIVVNKGGCP